MPQLRENSSMELDPPPYKNSQPIPKLNIVIQIVGTRGDVQPFVALGHSLQKYGHRIRIATHPVFKKFVERENLEFFSISGDPEKMMAFMVKNPSLAPSLESVKKGEISSRRREIEGILDGCWRSCIEGGDGMAKMPVETEMPFVADVIIANPPSFAHIHLAERLGIPVHMMFTMPWQPTEAFPHPLAKINPEEKNQAKANRVSYFMMEMMTWQGLGDIINNFREKTLELDAMGPVWASTVYQRLAVPFTYCWSPALIPKPSDWGTHTSVAGFYFMDQQPSSYSPPPDLAEFLGAGPTPIYIGFGSIVIDDPKALTQIILEAVQRTGVRAIVSRGSAGLGAGVDIPKEVFLLGDCPHSWLFQKVAAVVHHGGAGTTAAGIATGNPTIIVPFFGDQHFWGKMIARAGAGAEPIVYKDISVEKLAEAIKFVLLPSTREAAANYKARIAAEDGAKTGTELFHQELPRWTMCCDLFPERAAVWTYKKDATQLKLSAVSAALLAKEGMLRPDDLTLSVLIHVLENGNANIK
jgi:UDP:flavonoid glycosyltransferase YjiC (YdhE family)